MGITNNNYIGLTISNNLQFCTDTYIQDNTYNNSSCMLATTYHTIEITDAPWWSINYTTDMVSFYELFYNDPSDLNWLFILVFMSGVQNSCIQVVQT